MERDLHWWFNKSLSVARHPWLFSKRLGYNLKRFAFDNMNRFGCYEYPYKIIFIAGMPLSGTTWVKNLFARVPGYFTRRMPMPADLAYRQDVCDSAFSYVNKYGNTLIKTHLNPTESNLSCIFRNGVEKVVVVYRDLRDVAVSEYYRLMEFPKPESAYDYADCNYRAMDRESGLSKSVENIAKEVIPWIKGWFDVAKKYPGRCYFIKYEDLNRDTKSVFKKALMFYEIELSDEIIGRIVEVGRGRRNVKKNMDAAKVLPFAYASNFRSGKVGGWKKEFSDEHIKKSKSLLGEILIELGYEKDLNW